jgi:hypothetical protein
MRASHFTACESCGSHVPLVAVAVRHRDTGARRTLELCSRCAESKDRVWRWLWLLESEPAPTGAQTA